MTADEQREVDRLIRVFATCGVAVEIKPASPQSYSYSAVNRVRSRGGVTNDPVAKLLELADEFDVDPRGSPHTRPRR